MRRWWRRWQLNWRKARAIDTAVLDLQPGDRVLLGGRVVHVDRVEVGGRGRGRNDVWVVYADLYDEPYGVSTWDRARYPVLP